MKEKKVSHSCELKISDWYIQLTFIYDFPIIFYLNIHSKYSTIIMKEEVASGGYLLRQYKAARLLISNASHQKSGKISC